MNKILCILMAVIALSAVIECKVGVEDNTNQNDLCSIVGCVNEKPLNRQKRARGRAVEILGGVRDLVTGILDSTWGHVGRMQEQKGEERVIIGGGSYNDNTVTFDESDEESDDDE